MVDLSSIRSETSTVSGTARTFSARQAKKVPFTEQRRHRTSSTQDVAMLGIAQSAHEG